MEAVVEDWRRGGIVYRDVVVEASCYVWKYWKYPLRGHWKIRYLRNGRRTMS